MWPSLPMLGTALIEDAVLLLIDKVTIGMNDVKCNEIMEMLKNMKKEYHNWFEKWYRGNISDGGGHDGENTRGTYK